MPELISIIIVNWNGKRWLKKCLDSLCSQTYENFEVIFVDNASTDDSVEFVTNNYSEVVVVRSDENLGFAGGNNLGIDSARGDLLLFLNTDTWIEDFFIEKLVGFYKSHDFSVVGPLEASYDTAKKRSPYTSTIDPFGWPVYRPTNKTEAIQTFYLTGVCFLVSKELYLKSGGFDNDYFMYCEEVDWFWRQHLLGEKIAYSSDIFVYHAGGGSGEKGIRYATSLWRNQNIPQMLLKNYSWYNLVWVMPIYLIQCLFEVLVFLLLLKPKIAWSYIEGLWFNLRFFQRTIKKRALIQKTRLVSDFQIMREMYLGFGKAVYLHRIITGGKK